MPYLILFASVVLALPLVEIFNKWLTRRNMDMLTGFTGAFLFAILIFHLIPEMYEGSDRFKVGMAVAAGLLVQMVLEMFTGGIDHGHVHAGEEAGHDVSLTWSMYAGLFLHTFIETVPIGAGADTLVHAHGAVGHSPLLWGVAMHTLPMAMMLYIFMRNLGYVRAKSVTLMLIFALAAPAGMLTGKLAPVVSEYYPYSMAFVAGILIHVTASMLFGAELGRTGKWMKLLTVASGFVLGYAIS